MKTFDPSALKWGIITAKNDQLIACFENQKVATQFYQTLNVSGVYTGQDLRLIDVATGHPVGAELAESGDRVS